MRVWVDLANSPQVLVLTPLMRELERRGHQLVVTTRAFAQTVQLADRAGLRHCTIGGHGGQARFGSIRSNLARAAQLAAHVRPKRVDLALSHNSYSQAVAARLLGVPFVTMMDYEHQRANHLAFRLARRVLLPTAFPLAMAEAFGAKGKIVTYPGLKEELYLGDFRPEPNFLECLGVPKHRTLVVMRPPGTWASYYRGSGELFWACLDRALAGPGTFVVFLPRIAAQADGLRREGKANLLIPERAVDGPNLLYHADVVVSAGGTMNREAAVLATPAYSVFEGKMSAVDRILIDRGRLVAIESGEHAASIRFVKSAAPRTLPAPADELVSHLTDAVLDAA